jgi:hypothetical protein
MEVDAWATRWREREEGRAGLDELREEAGVQFDVVAAAVAAAVAVAVVIYTQIFSSFLQTVKRGKNLQLA